MISRQQDKAHSDHEWRQRVTEMNRTLYRGSDDPRLVYEPRPSSSYSMGEWDAAFNSAAIRDEREFDPIPTGRRIAVLGDSIAWGEHLEHRDTFGHRLEGRMPGTEVLNFGVTGYDTAQAAAWYERGARPLHPTDAVLVFCLNDALIMSGPWSSWADDEQEAQKDAQDAFFERVAPIRAETVERVMSKREDSARFKLLARAWTRLRTATYHRSSGYTDELLLAYAEPAMWQKVEAGLQTLGAALEADEVEAYLVISPVLRDWDGYRWSSIHEQVRAAGEAAGFVVIDPLEGWRGAHEPDALRFYGDSIHYSATGNEALARAVAEVINAPIRAGVDSTP